MLQYKVKVVGLHYAANPTYEKEMGKVPEMEEHTIEVLRELDEVRPLIILMPEPDNPCDPLAVMARAQGKRIGYVSRSDLETVHCLLKQSSKPFLMGIIDKVEMWKRGNLYIHIETHDALSMVAEPWGAYNWSDWNYNLPLLPFKDTWYACQEAEYMIEQYYYPFENDKLLNECESYLEVWLNNSLYDISDETYKFCNQYIARFGSHENPRVREWAERLKKHRTAFYGSKRSVSRMEWWNSLQDSVEMQMLWDKWQYETSYNLRKGFREIDAHLRRLPDSLYALVGDLDRLFASLYYHRVPRKTLWSIYSALLIRIRICKMLEIEMMPLPEDSVEYGSMEEAAVSCIDTTSASPLPEVLCTPEATVLLEKLRMVGMLDEQGKPVGLSNSEKGQVANELATYLNLPSRWKVFGNYWGIDSEILRSYYNRSMNQRKTLDFKEKLKECLSE